MNIAIITGASSGMGRDFVFQIADKFSSLDEIWVIARRRDRLYDLKEKINNVVIKPIPMDITNKDELEKLKVLLRQNKPKVRFLVNAAGYGVIGKFQELTKDNIGMCELNCSALTEMINIVLPYMSKKRSNIINLASSAAFSPQPSFAVYAATKSYVLSLSTALNQELRHTGIRVTAVCPGPVDTEFFDRAEEFNKVKIYKKMFKADSNKVVCLALKDAMRGSHISVYGLSMKSFRVLSKIVPHSIIVKFIR